MTDSPSKMVALAQQKSGDKQAQFEQFLLDLFAWGKVFEPVHGSITSALFGSSVQEYGIKSGENLLLGMHHSPDGFIQIAHSKLIEMGLNPQHTGSLVPKKH